MGHREDLFSIEPDSSDADPSEIGTLSGSVAFN